MVWDKSGTTTLGSNSGTIDLTMLSTTFNTFMVHALQNGTLDSKMRFGVGGVDAGTNYASRQVANGGSDGTGTSGTEIDVGVGGYSHDSFHVGYFVNISGEEKLFIEWLVMRNTAGAGTAPMREEVAAKWVNTAAQADTIQYLESGTGAATDIATNSNLTVLGTD